MHRYSFLVLLLCYNALCISEKCVTYNFEENQKLNFTNTYGICQGFFSWDVGKYSSLAIDSPHRDSSTFIKPLSTLSCISSFKFSITASGIFELNVYMEPKTILDQITLLVFQSLPGANDATVGNAVLSPNMPNFVSGWQTMRVNIVGFGTHEGYITLLGMASESSTVLVDSFRYIAPNYDKDSCVIYPSDKPTTEKTTIQVITDKSTTTSKPSTITIPTIPVTTTTEIPTTIPETNTTEVPATIPETTSITGPSTTTTTTVPVTTTPEIQTTIPTTPVTSTTEIPTTKPSTEKPSSITEPANSTITETPDTSTTERATTPTSTTVTTTTSARPRFFASILLIKIKKFFR